jgi:hypothetical protein
LPLEGRKQGVGNGWWAGTGAGAQATGAAKKATQ